MKKELEAEPHDDKYHTPERVMRRQEIRSKPFNDAYNAKLNRVNAAIDKVKHAERNGQGNKSKDPYSRETDSVRAVSATARHMRKDESKKAKNESCTIADLRALLHDYVT